MTTIKEMTIASIAEPASVKIERNSKGYNFELGIHAESFDIAVPAILAARARLEKELVSV